MPDGIFILDWIGIFNVGDWSFPLKTVARVNHCRIFIIAECTNDDTSGTQITHDTDTIISNKNNKHAKALNDQNGVRKLLQTIISLTIMTRQSNLKEMHRCQLDLEILYVQM